MPQHLSDNNKDDYTYTPASHTHTKSEISNFSEGDYATAAQGALADTATQPADIQNFETSTQLDDRDTSNRNTDNHTSGTTNKVFTATEQTKLAGVATGATANSSDATLLDRANHTGTQAAGTISGLSTVATTGAYSDLSGTPDLSVYDNFHSETNSASFPATGDSDVLYLETSTGILYRWNGTGYSEISAALALGETSSTAYRGDRGKTAYDHSLITSGNPHSVSKSDLGLGNVENTALSTWAGSTNVTTLGTISTGTWQGTAIGDSYISSAATWNGKISASSTNTLTNKTFDANGTGNSLSNVEVADFAASAIVTELEGISSNDNDTTIPTSAAVKDYVDNNAGGGNSSVMFSHYASSITVSNSTNVYYHPNAGRQETSTNILSGTDSIAYRVVIPYAITVIGLYYSASSDAGSGGNTIHTIYDDTVSTSASITVPSGTLSGSWTGSLSVAAGSTLNINVQGDASRGSGSVSHVQYHIVYTIN